MNSLLPPNATALEQRLAQVLGTVDDIPVPLRTLWNADTCPLALLPWLAWQLSIDAWKSYWPESVKRERVRQALAIQRRKGTVESVRSVVESFGGSAHLGRSRFGARILGARHTTGGEPQRHDRNSENTSHPSAASHESIA